MAVLAGRGGCFHVNPTQARDRAMLLARTDAKAALEVALGIDDPWFACQALGGVARFADDASVLPIAKRAIEASRRTGDVYKVVGAAAWPVRALVERHQERALDAILDELLGVAPQILPLASRAEGLFLLFSAIYPAGRASWERVFAALAAASNPMVHWRQERNIRDAILIIASDDLEFAEEACRWIQDVKAREKIARRMAAGERLSVRGFFHG